MSSRSPSRTIGTNSPRSCSMPWVPIRLLISARVRPQTFDDRRQRHDVGLLADLDDHAVHDRQRQRQGQLDRHAAAAHRLERNAAAEVLDIAAHDVHADAAAGNVGHRLGGREAGQHDQIADFVLGQLNVRRRPALFLGDLEHALGIDAGAVVLDLDDNTAAAMFGRQPDRRLPRACRRRARSAGVSMP